MRASAESLVRQLTTRGYSLHKFTVESRGKYAAADADWNYKDVPHLNVLHTQVRAIVATMDDDVITTLNLQKVAGIPFPVALVNYATGVDSQTYYTTMGPYVMVVFTKYVEEAPNRTRVVTTYHMLAKGWPKLLFPILERIVRNNYRTLMSEDLPMRDRRGTLRERGFTFATDGTPRAFPETIDTNVVNVIPPARSSATEEVLTLAQIMQGSSTLIGMDDDRGLRIERDNGTVSFFPRICMHEGAPLDCQALKDRKVSCPWHGKVIKRLAELQLVEGATVSFDRYGARVSGGNLIVRLPQ